MSGSDKGQSPAAIEAAATTGQSATAGAASRNRSAGLMHLPISSFSGISSVRYTPIKQRLQLRTLTGFTVLTESKPPGRFPGSGSNTARHLTGSLCKTWAISSGLFWEGETFGHPARSTATNAAVGIGLSHRPPQLRILRILLVDRQERIQQRPAKRRGNWRIRTMGWCFGKLTADARQR